MTYRKIVTNTLLSVLLFLSSSFSWAHGPVALPFSMESPLDGARLVRYTDSLTQKIMTEWKNPLQLQQLSIESHKSGVCAGFMDITDQPDNPVVDQPSFNQLMLVGPKTPKQQSMVNPLLPKLSADKLHDFVNQLSSFPNRHCRSEEGQKSAKWIKEQYERLSLGRKDIEVEYFQHKNLEQPSIIARIKGNGKNADEIVILGGHQDSVNQGSFGKPSAIAPGADDDASGTSTVLEVFRVLAESGHRPNRTIEFMAYSCEELGLLGSQDIAKKYKADQKNVVGVIQFDMTMYPGKDGHSITLINDNVDSDLTDFVKMLIDTYVGIPWQDSKCGYGCSDHASWTRNGFSSAFPFEAPMGKHNRKIHTTGDKLDILDTDLGLHFAKLGLAFAVEMSE